MVGKTTDTKTNTAVGATIGFCLGGPVGLVAFAAVGFLVNDDDPADKNPRASREGQNGSGNEPAPNSGKRSREEEEELARKKGRSSLEGVASSTSVASENLSTQSFSQNSGVQAPVVSAHEEPVNQRG